MKATTRHRQLARDCLAAMGGRAEISEIRQEFVDRLDAEEARLLMNAKLNNYVAGLLRQCKPGDLPWALSNGDQFVQRPLLTLDERRHIIARYRKQASRSAHRARQLAQETAALYDVDADELLSEVEGAA